MSCLDPHVGLLAWLLATACGGNGSVPDAAPADGQLSCESLAAEWWSAVETLDRSCGASTDCLLVGRPFGQSCECIPALVAVSVAVNRDAYVGSGAEAIEQAWLAQDCMRPNPCDDPMDESASCDAGTCTTLEVFGCI